MLRNSKNAFRLVVGLVLATGIAWLVHADRLRTERFFSAALQSAQAEEDVSVNGTLFHVANGSVFRSGTPVTGLAELPALKLAYAKALARTAPILALPEVNLQALLGAIADLAQAQNALAQSQPDAPDATVVRKDLYPIGFLKSAAALEAARRSFLATGSDASERAYDRAFTLTLAAYDADLENFRTGFESVVPENVRSYTAGGFVVTRGAMVHALDSLAQNGARARREFQTRASCLAGVIRTCEPSELEAPALSADSVTAPSETEVALASRIRNMFKEAGGEPEPSPSPLIALPSAVCLTGTGAPPLFATTDAPQTAGGALNALLYVGDLRLLKSAAHPDVAFDAFFAARGITFLPASPLLYYECPYAGTDFGAVFATRVISERATTQPLSAESEGAVRPALQAQERKLALTEPLILASSAEAYIRAARAVSGNPALRNETADLALVLTRPAAGLTPLLAQMAEIEQENVFARARNGVPADTSAAALFYFRSAFISLFFGNDPSFAKAPDSYFSQLPSFQGREPFLWFSQLPASQQEQATNDLQTYIQYHRLAIPGSR